MGAHTSDHEVLFHDRHDDLTSLVTNTIALAEKGFAHVTEVTRGDDNEWWVLSREPITPEEAQAWFEVWQLEPDVEAELDALEEVPLPTDDDAVEASMAHAIHPEHVAAQLQAGWPTW